MTMVFAKLKLKLFKKYHCLLILHEIQTIQRFSISALMYKFFVLLSIILTAVNKIIFFQTEQNAILKIFHTTISMVGLSLQNSKFLQL